MKRYSIILFLAVFFGVTIFSACEEEATLDGATEVYITLDPTDISLRIGDTVKISAKVTNVSGKIINTPISWSLADETVARLLGDSAIVAVNGGQEKRTTLKATLENGKYAITTVSVLRNLPEGVTCVANDSTMPEMTSKQSYNIPHDSVMFAVSPKTLLYDYEPQVKLEGVTAYDPLTTINYEKGIVTVHFTSPRESGEGKITVSLGESSTAQSGSCTITIAPQIFATFYGEYYANMPYLATRPGKEILPMYFAYTYEKEMDINTSDTIRIAMNVQSGLKEDIENAYGAYRWEIASGSSVVITSRTNEYVENEGFDAVLSVRAGVDEGDTEIHCITPDTVFVAIFQVKDFKTRYPVDEITVDPETVSMPVGGTVRLTTGVIPATSYAYHKPVVTAADPTKVSVGSYDGNVITLRGLAMGETELILTANGKEKRVPVTITEGINSVLWVSGNARTIFAGQTVQWGVDARTSSGGENPYEVTWHSSNPDAVKAEQTGSDNKHGTITGLAVGSSNVTAEVAGVMSDPAPVEVIALPNNFTLTAENTQKDKSSVYADGSDLNDLSVNFALVEGAAYKSITITLPGVYTGTPSGTYTVPSGTILNIDGAEAEVTSGSVTVTTTGSEAIVSFTISGSVGGQVFSMKAENVPVLVF